MSKHYLEAVLTKAGPFFRIICEDPNSCRLAEGNTKGCIYRQQFLQTKDTVDMVGWPDGTEYVLGSVELRKVYTDPATFEPTPNLVSRDS